MEWVDKLLDVTIFVLVVAVFVPLERLLPFHDQKILRRNWYHDLSFWVLNRIAVYSGGALMIAAALFLGHYVIPETLTTSIGELPLVISVPLAILVADLTFYTVHRASHAFPVLWQFHAVHHSIQDMDWLASIRVHPVDQLITTISGICLQLALGFSPATLLITGTIYMWQSFAVHSNVLIRLGPLGRIFVGPIFHHWHHSTDPLARDRNFAGQLAFLDWIFGTAYYPDDRLPVQYGIDDPVPDSYVRTFLYPLKRLNQMARGTLQENVDVESVSLEGHRRLEAAEPEADGQTPR